jgi:hypothetical protein
MGRLTVAEAAAALKTTPTAILMLLRRKELIGQEVAGGWEVERSSLEELRAARQENMPLVECRSACSAKVGGCASCGSAAE